MRELGRGAMGVVFLAEAESGDFVARDNVAIKVLRPDIKSSASAIKRFQREARLLADLDSPAITQLFEVSEDQGLMFFAMEYIPGISLQQLIRERGSLAEGDALRLIQQVAIGLACLHNRGVIHRDVKPSNILIDTEKLSSHDQSTSHEIALGAVKLTDLGLARMIRSVESIELTHTNAVVGTPRYMAPEILAPELFSGEKRATPAADLYSLGATLFEMLTGRPPLEANSLIGLADEHLYARPPQLDAIVAGVSKPVSQLVAKMLAKSPTHRFVDVHDFLVVLEAILAGEPTRLETTGLVRQSEGEAPLTFELVCEMQASPSVVWQYVSNTDRMNHAVELPAVEYSIASGDQGTMRRHCEARVAGLTFSWVEEPFEWIEPNSFSVVRSFSHGPLLSATSTVQLFRRGRGTTLLHRLEVLPRNRFGRWLTQCRLGRVAMRSFDRVYRRIDSVLGPNGSDTEVMPDSKTIAIEDVYESANKIGRKSARRIDEIVSQLAKVGVDPAVLIELSRLVRRGSVQTVGRIRPVQLARKLGFSNEATIQACIHAAHQGLLQHRWEIHCPSCQVPTSHVNKLHDVTTHGRCQVCGCEFHNDLAHRVELVFRAHPRLRQSETQIYCIGGPWHQPRVVTQLLLKPHSSRELSLSLIEGRYQVGSPQLSSSVDLEIVSQCNIDRTEIVFGDGSDNLTTLSLKLPDQSLTLVNRFDRELLIRIERMGKQSELLTAAEVASLSTFRRLFPDEIPATDHATTLSGVAFVVMERCSEGRMVTEEDGFENTRNFLQIVRDLVSRGKGGCIKTIGETTVSVFHDAADAITVIAKVRKEVQPIDKLKIAIHVGPAVMMNINGQIEYFGETFEDAIRMVNGGQPGELLLSQTAIGCEPIEKIMTSQLSRCDRRLFRFNGKGFDVDAIPLDAAVLL
ncbi:protein kinase domain-containing protein [Rhodopirellula sp. MGV]|uniref:protein kinase domain-containing protein n=1 Tax=Rhodopirellula sp. MGV TaxID=2023130 RepID=UPI0021014B1D|nr:protein kinase [Rhodopirellula sp. MGV]